MALLPAIASFFNVTVDALLGIDDATARQKVEQYLSRFQEALAKGDVDACIAIARQGISEFPNDYALLNKLMYALFLSGDADGNLPGWEEAMQKNDAEITALGERIMKYCPDQDIRLEATARLAFHHCEMGRKARGREIYESLPSWEFSRQNQIWWALEGEDRLENCRERIRAGYALILGGIYNLGYGKLLPDATLATAFQKSFALECWMYDGRGAPYRFPQMRCQYAEVLARLGKSDEAFAQLKLAVAEAKEFDGRPDTWTAASLLLGEWRAPALKRPIPGPAVKSCGTNGCSIRLLTPSGAWRSLRKLRRRFPHNLMCRQRSEMEQGSVPPFRSPSLLSYSVLLQPKAVPAPRCGGESLPSTAASHAPVTPGSTFAQPRRQQSASSAKATASFASLEKPKFSCVITRIPCTANRRSSMRKSVWL